MSGKVTRADNVRGERKGQKVKRTWTFTPSCASGACSTVRLRRERSSKQFDKVTLKRSGSSAYAGSGKFYVSLKCNGRTYKKGGIAYYTVKVRVTKSATLQSKSFATAISATYSNTRRVNNTPCAGSIGRDAGSYSGKHAAPVAPTADFTFAESTPGHVDFADKSSAKGARLVAWSWDFGDGSKATTRNPSHDYAPGTYTVTLTIRDSNRLTDDDSQQVTIP
jgi:PKD repeat protein